MILVRCSSDSLMCKKLDSDLNGCRCEKRGLGKTVCDLRKTSHIYILKILSRHTIGQEKYDEGVGRQSDWLSDDKIDFFFKSRLAEGAGFTSWH